MMMRSVVFGLVTSSVALAADSNGDGCQDEFAGNGACVDVDATVDGSSSVGANAQVREEATIGPEVALGSNVVVASRASLAGRVAHSSNPLPIGANTVIGRGAQLGADHVLGNDVTIGRSAVAGARLTVAAGGTIGYAAQVGDDVTIGANAVAGNLVTIGDFATLGDGAVVARSVTILNGANSGDGAAVNGIVGPDVLIAAGSRIELGARVRKQADIGAGAAIESTARIGRGAVIEAGATVYGRVAPTARVGAGATVEAGASVARGGEVCAGNTLPSGSQVVGDGTWPVEGCIVSTSCQTIKVSNPSAADGVYSIDPDGDGGADAFDVYCDMTTDGGGWTFFGHVNSNSGATGFFSDQGTYDPNRGDPNALYSAAGRILPNLPHTEMMVTLDSAVPATAASANKIVVYQYANGHPGFNSGPLPCVGLATGFNYRTTTSGGFSGGGTSNACSTTQWYTRTNGSAAYLALLHSTTLGTYWGTGMGGNNSWNHDSWWYVR